MPYFDVNATAYCDPIVRSVVGATLAQYGANPSSPHPKGCLSAAQLDWAKAFIADFLGVDKEGLVLNSGATESVNALFAYWASTQRPLVISAVEHTASLEAGAFYYGKQMGKVKVQPCGRMDMEALASILNSKQNALVSLQVANHETGVVQDWQQALKICKQHGAKLHLDASQGILKHPLKGMEQADALSFSAHKVGGLKGVGVLALGADLREAHFQKGGSQQQGRRAGTEDVAGAIALCVALSLKSEGGFPPHNHALAKTLTQDPHSDALEALLDACKGSVHTPLATTLQTWNTGRHHLEEQVQQHGNVEVIGSDAPRIANTSLLLMPQHDGMRWVQRLASLGFYVSTGSACTAGSHTPSPVLEAMGVEASQARRAVRISAPWSVEPDHYTALAHAFTQARNALAQQSNFGTVVEL